MSGWGFFPGRGVTTVAADDATSYASLRRNLRINNLNGIYAVISFNLVYPFFGIFALKIGATNTEVAVLSSLPALISMLTIIPGAMFVERSSRKKYLTGVLIALSRLLILGAAAVPFFPRHAQVTALIAMVTLMTLPAWIASVGWQGLIAEIIPSEWRGEAFAVRNRWMAFFGMGTVLAGGWVMDLLRFPYGYQLVFLLGFVAGVAETYYFTQFATADDQGAQPPASNPREKGQGLKRWPARLVQELKSEWARVAAQKNLLHFVVASFFFHFAWMGAWPVFTVYKVDTLRASNLWMSVFVVAGSIGAIVSYRWWARLAEKYSNVTVLFWSALGIAVLTLPWLWAESLIVGAQLDLYSGVTVAGFQLVIFNRLLEVVTPERRTMDLAYFNTLVQVAATVSPLFGMWLYNVVGFGATMVIFTCLRLLAALGYLRSEPFATAIAGASPRRQAALPGRK